MPDEEHKKHGDNPHPRGTDRIEVRPRNWLVPVILLTLRDCASYGYELMERTAKFGFQYCRPRGVGRLVCRDNVQASTGRTGQ
jgi:PadR family transcriptional regulator PadR